MLNSIIYLKNFENTFAYFSKSIRQAYHINNVDCCEKSTRISKGVNLYRVIFLGIHKVFPLWRRK